MVGVLCVAAFFGVVALVSQAVIRADARDQAAHETPSGLPVGAGEFLRFVAAIARQL